VTLRREGVRTLSAAALVALSVAVATSFASAAPRAAASLPLIRHVFVIMLENQDYSGTFASPRADPYLARTLVRQGTLLSNYYGVGHYSNDNYIGFVSGQLPNESTQQDCARFVNFPIGDGQLASGQQRGDGCVYPANVATIASQLTNAGFSWRGYMQDMGNVPTREATTCAHPAVGAKDPSVDAVTGDGYVTRHDPFVYFHSIIDHRASCQAHVVPLGTANGAMPKATPPGVNGLARDLSSLSTTANFNFITPNLCNDAHDYPCANQPTASTRFAAMDQFLSTWVPLIEHSRAFRDDGLLLITFDEAESPSFDARSCCHEQAGPSAQLHLNGVTGPGGGRVGALLISPDVRAGVVVRTPYNHYSALASIEDLFALHRLGAAATVSSTFDKGIYK
jgi:hypothetical protein